MLVKTKNQEFEAQEITGLKLYWGLRFQRPRPVLLNSGGRKTGIDMFFCFWPMDLFWIKNNKVEKKALARPFRIYAGAEADYVLETPVNLTKLRKGDRIIIKQT